MRHKIGVSVIVPVYNVENYLEQCIQSILRQSYCDFELILIDDGSQDRSGKICDKFALKDDRIIVIHKKNEGQSAARNEGIKIACGEYVCFIDSDDWIAEQYLEFLYSYAKKYNAEIVQCGYFYAYVSYCLTDKKNCSTFCDRIIVYTKEEAMLQLIQHQDIKNFSWGKIISTAIVKNNLLPNIENFEDLYWFQKIVHTCSKYIIMNVPMYYYRQHQLSLTHEYNITSLLLLKGWEERIQFVNKFYPKLGEVTYIEYLKLLISLYGYACQNKYLKKEYEKYKQYALDKYGSIWEQHIKNASFLLRCKYFLLSYSDIMLLGILKLEAIYNRWFTSQALYRIKID